MKQRDKSASRPALKQWVAEASQALARLDAGRLEELALCCRALRGSMETLGARDRALLAREAHEATGAMVVFGRVLHETRANLEVMNRMRGSQLEYSGAPAQQPRWALTETRHGDN